jgi:hypothetical protein
MTYWLNRCLERVLGFKRTPGSPRPSRQAFRTIAVSLFRNRLVCVYHCLTEHFGVDNCVAVPGLVACRAWQGARLEVYARTVPDWD